MCRSATSESAAEALDALPHRAADAMERLQQLCVAHGVG